MKQKFKAIYFPGNSDVSPSKTITLAFSEQDDVYDQIRSLSSHEIRLLLGYQLFDDIQKASDLDQLPLNTFCLRTLREKIKSSGYVPAQQLAFPNFSTSRIPLDPIQATFRGGIEEPLHSWYPYLEGYSPKFVETIIDDLAPQARSIFDPFAGTGTTPITALTRGVQSYYCEINPLLQSLIDVKILAHTLSLQKRLEIVPKIYDLATKWEELLHKAKADQFLHKSYTLTFGESLFFDTDTYDQVLRARAVIDDLAITNSPLAKFATIAIVASLLSSSNLVRSGDIRYRSSNEMKRKTNFAEETIRRLHVMANDLERIGISSDNRPKLICEDARNIGLLPKFDIDLIITSPPYLNGTNYFRNTKIELWFLRCLQSQDDLAGFRLKAVTSGINDVTVRKTEKKPPHTVQDVVNELAKQAYDVRISRMVAGYFTDMDLIFRELKKHVTAETKIAIDIGDSVYAGVHVPVQQLLTGILESYGYHLEKEITLRKRLSRDKTELSQVLLMFSVCETALFSHSSAEIEPWWHQNWKLFKDELPFKKQPFAKRNWGHPLHSLCSYQGKMKPSLAHFLVKTFAPSQGTLLDPFAGVGTIPFEAALNGIKSYGFDISPAAIAISKAKLENANAQECREILNNLALFINENEPEDVEYLSSKSISYNGAIPDYYHPSTLREILLARRYFLNSPPSAVSAALVFSSLLHILHGNRPYALSRNSHPITPFKPTGDYEYKSLIHNLTDKVERSLSVAKPNCYVEGKMMNQDATGWWPQDVKDIDAIITSPPFFDSTRFHMGNWLRLWFCGWEKEDFTEKPLAFVDERQKQSFSIYEPIFRQARERLKPNGVLVLHLGESKKCNMAQELSEVARNWFRVEDLFDEDVTDLEQHGIRDKGTVTKHQFLVLT